jgi:hypothetical protein
MNNLEFLDCILQSFKVFLVTGSRSNKKLKVLHGGIANDLANKLGENYSIKSLGYNNGKEGKIQGRYINKNVDITVYKNEIPIAGIGIKFVMQNYSQNSINYFENMLGETANIRSANIPYFQIFVIPDDIPYYEKEGRKISKWETVTPHNASKYKILSEDIVESSIHTPVKTLLYIVKFPVIENKSNILDEKDYKFYYQSLQDFSILTTDMDFGIFSSNLIFNDYEDYINKIVHRILSI